MTCRQCGHAEAETWRGFVVVVVNVVKLGPRALRWARVFILSETRERGVEEVGAYLAGSRGRASPD